MRVCAVPCGWRSWRAELVLGGKWPSVNVLSCLFDVAQQKERSGWEHRTAKQQHGTTTRPRTPRQLSADDFFPSMFSSMRATTSRLRSWDGGWLICHQRRTRTDSLKSCPSRTTRAGLNPLSLFASHVHEPGHFSWKLGKIASQLRLNTRGNTRLCLPHKLTTQW